MSVALTPLSSSIEHLPDADLERVPIVAESASPVPARLEPWRPVAITAAALLLVGAFALVVAPSAVSSHFHAQENGAIQLNAKAADLNANRSTLSATRETCGALSPDGTIAIERLTDNFMWKLGMQGAGWNVSDYEFRPNVQTKITIPLTSFWGQSPSDSRVTLKLKGRGVVYIDAGKACSQGRVRYLVNGSTYKVVTTADIHAKASISFAGDTTLGFRAEDGAILVINHVGFDCAPPVTERYQGPVWGKAVTIANVVWKATHPENWACDQCVVDTEDGPAWGYSPLEASSGDGEFVHAGSASARTWCATRCHEWTSGKCTGFAYPLAEGNQCYLMSNDCTDQLPGTPKLCGLRSPWGDQNEENVAWDFYVPSKGDGSEDNITQHPVRFQGINISAD